MKAPENPFAFPSPDDGRPSDGYGMLLRDWFAGQALAGFLASEDLKSKNAIVSMADKAGVDMASVRAAIVYAIADAMLAERAKTRGAA